MKKTYLKPSVEVEEVKIEKGFAVSPESQFGDYNRAGNELYGYDSGWVEF